MTRSHLGRIFLLAGLALIIGIFSFEAFSQEMSIIEVRRNIPLADTDPVYKDYYIGAATDLALKKGVIVTATRKIAIKDATGTATFGEFVIPVGLLKVIAVQGRLAVAREFKLIAREDEPMLDQLGVMIGDKILLGK